jgi:hypothetical protein
MTQQHIEFFRVEANRLETFEIFPIELKPVITSLSRNGFMFTGNRCVCIFCSKQINQINSRDDILQMHYKLSKSCKFYKSGLNIPINEENFIKDQASYLQLMIQNEEARRKKNQEKKLSHQST